MTADRITQLHLLRLQSTRCPLSRSALLLRRLRRRTLAGFTLAAAGDLLLVHASRGRYDDVWQRYAERFCAKHRVGHIDPAPPPYYETAFTSRQQVRSFYGMLLQWADENIPESPT